MTDEYEIYNDAHKGSLTIDGLFFGSNDKIRGRDLCYLDDVSLAILKPTASGGYSVDIDFDDMADDKNIYDPADRDNNYEGWFVERDKSNVTGSVSTFSETDGKSLAVDVTASAGWGLLLRRQVEKSAAENLFQVDMYFPDGLANVTDMWLQLCGGEGDTAYQNRGILQFWKGKLLSKNDIPISSLDAETWYTLSFMVDAKGGFYVNLLNKTTGVETSYFEPTDKNQFKDDVTEINILTKRDAQYRIDNFKINPQDNFNVIAFDKESVEAGETITASVNTWKTGTRLIVAVMDKETNELKSISFDTAGATEGLFDSCEASVTTPDDNGEYMVKAFLWDAGVNPMAASAVLE